jgi:hypothetical protein
VRTASAAKRDTEVCEARSQAAHVAMEGHTAHSTSIQMAYGWLWGGGLLVKVLSSGAEGRVNPRGGGVRSGSRGL